MMTIEEILAAFGSVPKRQFPTEAVEAALAQQETITPFLLQVLAVTPEELEAQYQAEDDKGEDTVYYTFDFALYLLGQFREQQAFLPILKFFLTPGDLTQDITGDIVTDGLGELLAATYNGDISALTGVVSDEQVSAYIKIATIETMCILWQEQQLDDAFFINYLTELFDTYPRENQGDGFWTFLVSRVAYCRLDALRSRLEQAFDDQLVESFFIVRSDLGKIYSGEYAPRKQSSQIDTMSLASWRWFRPDEPRLEFPINGMDKWLDTAYVPSSPTKSYLPLQPVETVKREGPKVGRNDLCPCGSGKKYKKCCGSKS